MRNFKSYIMTLFYAVTAVGLLIVCLETDATPTVDIAFGNSATALPQKYVLLILTILFFVFTFISLVQELMRRPLVKFMCWIHYIVTIACLLILRHILLVELATGEGVDYSLPENIDDAAVQNAEWKSPLTIVGITFVAAQALFLLNVIITQFKRRQMDSVEPIPEQTPKNPKPPTEPIGSQEVRDII